MPMRRIFFWYLPLFAAALAAVVFGFGFYSFLRGDTGARVGPAPARVDAQPPRGVIAPLILGDSLARGTGDESGLGIGGRLAAELSRAKIKAQPPVNIAVNGAKTADLLQQLETKNVRTLVAEANVIVISIGGNDLWGSTDARAVMMRGPTVVIDQVVERVATVVQKIREANPRARIFLLGLYNPFAATPEGPRLGSLVSRWNARLLERFAADPNLTVVPTEDIFSHRNRLSFDRFHPDDEGYAIIARRIGESL